MEYENETWKDIAGYEGLYQISSTGRVKSLQRIRDMNLPGHTKGAPVNERILKFGQSLGYLAVTLAKDGVNTKIRVHKLVANAFIGPAPSPVHQINHKDGNKHNNDVANLEWVTPSENQRHAIKTGLRKDSRRRKTVNQYDRTGRLIRSWNGYAEIKEALGYPPQAICGCCKGRSPTAYGFVWRLEHG